jgi:hypothetical protein
MSDSLIQASIDAKNAEAAQNQAPPVIDTPVAKPVSDQQKPAETTPVTPVVKTEPVVKETPVASSDSETKTPETTKVPSNAGAIVNIGDEKITTPATEKPEATFSDVLSQQYKGRFKTQKDLDDFITQADKPRLKFANEIVAQLNQAINNGMSEQDFLRAHALNPDTMTDLEAIKQRTKLENPGLSDLQVNRLLNKKYSAEEDDAEAVQDADILTITDGSSAKRFLTEYKEKFKVEMPDEASLQAETADREAAAQAQVDQYQQRIDQHIASRGTEKYQISLNEKQAYTFEPSAEQLAEVRDQVADLSTFFDRYKGDDGAEKLYDDMFWAMNRETMMRSMAQAISNDGKKDILKDLVNPGNLDQATDATAGGEKNWQQQAADVILR